jgi:hypothetical protein
LPSRKVCLAANVSHVTEAQDELAFEARIDLTYMGERGKRNASLLVMKRTVAFADAINTR